MRWMDRATWKDEFPLSPPPSFLLSQDISQTGWKVCLEELITVVEWSEKKNDLFINILEMRAVLLVLSAFQDIFSLTACSC